MRRTKSKTRSLKGASPAQPGRSAARFQTFHRGASEWQRRFARFWESFSCWWVCADLLFHIYSARTLRLHTTQFTSCRASSLYISASPGLYPELRSFHLFSAWFISRLVFSEWRSAQVRNGCAWLVHSSSARPITAFTSCSA